MNSETKFENWKGVILPEQKEVEQNTIIEDLHTPTYTKYENSYCFAGSKYYNLGQWLGFLTPADPDHAYKVTTHIQKKGNNARLLANLYGLNDEGKGITMDYLQPEGEDTLSYIYRPVEGVCALKLEVVFSCFGEGSASFTEPVIEILGKDEQKDTADSIIVATAYLNPPDGRYSFVGECLPRVEEILERAAKDPVKPDIMLFTETTMDRYTSIPFLEKGVREDCEGMMRVRAKAKETGIHVIFSIHEQTENGMYNTAYVIDDEGNIAGKYRKVQITYSELSGGMIPGEEIHCIDTKFGRIGIVTCWDCWFPETARELYKQGAKILFHPSAGKPLCMWESRARENGLPFVSSFAFDPEFCCIINSRGEVIARIDDPEKGYISANVLLGEETYTYWLGVGPDQALQGACERNLKKPEIREELY